MRGKRSKQYRKLMEQFSQTFGFREPYQILVDAELVKDACRFKMELEPALHRTVHGKVKPMITQCEIRKLYAQKQEPGISEAIDVAKTLERRRCGHHPDQYPEPLSTEECLQSVVDPKASGQNKHRYVVATQDQDVRRMLRGVRGTPLIYIKRSVMILEPMADESTAVRIREERMKFRAELKKGTGKRKRGEDEDDSEDDDDDDRGKGTSAAAQAAKDKKKNKAKGPKGPNPLAVKKAKKKTQDPAAQNKDGQNGKGGDEPAKRKRRRKNKAKGEGSEANGAAPAGAGAGAGAGAAAEE